MICWGGGFDYPSLRLDLKKYRIESENPEIWKDPDAKSLFQKIKNIENKIRDFETIESNIEYFKEFLTLAISENNIEYFDQLYAESKKILIISNKTRENQSWDFFQNIGQCWARNAINMKWK